MRWLNRLLGKPQQPEFPDDLLIPLLGGMVRPFQNEAVTEQIADALRDISDEAARGRFMQLLWQTCLSSILSRIGDAKGLHSGLDVAFKNFVLAQWQRSPGITLENEHTVFDYTYSQIGELLESPSEESILDTGIFMLSIAIQDQESFSKGLAYEWGTTAHSCWTLAMLETDKALGTGVELNAATARIDEQIYLLDYSEHYSEILEKYLTNRRMAELYLFRAWTAQFGFRVFASDSGKGDKLLSEVVNSSQYVGLAAFELVHGFSIESELGNDYMSLVEDRWGQYDSVIPERVAEVGVPIQEIISLLIERLEIGDGLVFFGLSTDFAAQLSLIKDTAAEIGISER